MLFDNSLQCSCLVLIVKVGFHFFIAFKSADNFKYICKAVLLWPKLSRTFENLNESNFTQKAFLCFTMGLLWLKIGLCCSKQGFSLARLDILLTSQTF